jgi:hypothetical protein
MLNKEIARVMVCFFHQKKHFYLINKILNYKHIINHILIKENEDAAMEWKEFFLRRKICNIAMYWTRGTVTKYFQLLLYYIPRCSCSWLKRFFKVYTYIEEFFFQNPIGHSWLCKFYNARIVNKNYKAYCILKTKILSWNSWTHFRPVIDSNRRSQMNVFQKFGHPYIPFNYIGK